MSTSTDHSTHPLKQFRFCPKCGSEEFLEKDFKAKTCETCGFQYYFNPSAAVAAFMTDFRDGRLRVLVARRAKEPQSGTYDLPGGFVDCYETGEEALLRELKEEVFEGKELSLLPSSVKYLFSLPNIYVYSGFEVHTLDLFYHVRVQDLTPLAGIGSDDVCQLIAIPVQELDSRMFGLESIAKAIDMVRTKQYLLEL